MRMYVREYKEKRKPSDRKDNNAPRVLGTQSKHCSGTYKSQYAFKYSIYIAIPQKDPTSMTLTAHFDIHGSTECNYHVRLKIGSTWVGVLLLYYGILLIHPSHTIMLMQYNIRQTLF